MFLNFFQPDAETNSYSLPTMLGSEDSEEGNSKKINKIMLIKTPVTGVIALKLNWILSCETETSQEEPPITSWNELSIIERVGLNRCNILTVTHNVIMYLINLILFIKLSTFLFSNSVAMSEKDLEVRPFTSSF